MRESEGYDLENEKELGEPAKDVKYPDECPECHASNPDNSDQCGNCEKKFEPVEQDVELVDEE